MPERKTFRDKDESQKPIAFEAYEKLAQRFSDAAVSKAENAYIEQPAIRAVIGNAAGLDVLDAGCGPGILSAYLLGQGARVTGFDVSPSMIRFARQRCDALDHGSRHSFHVADLSEALTFAGDECFDLIVSSLAIDYVKDWTIPLAEFYRVLKPATRLVFSVQHPFGSFTWYKLKNAFDIQYVEATWHGFGGEPVVVPDYYRPFEEIVNPLIGAGFTLKSVKEARPVSELRELDPRHFEKYDNFPTFMVIEAQKGD